jgi:hypothetical protein
MTGLMCAANVKLRTEIGECLLNLVAGHLGEPLAVAPLPGPQPRTSAFEDSKSVSWREISMLEANGAVEPRRRALMGRQTRGMRTFKRKQERINEIWLQTEFLSRRGGSKAPGHRMG